MITFGKPKDVWNSILVFGIVLIPINAVAFSTEYQIWPQTFSNAGNSITGVTYQVVNSIGQNVSSQVFNTQYLLRSGFLNEYSSDSGILFIPTTVPTEERVPDKFFKAFKNKINPNFHEQVRLSWS